MEKIIAAIRTLNDNLKIVATKVEELGERLDTLEKRVDGAFACIDTCGDTTARIDRRVAKLEADAEARLAELTERVYALEHAAPTTAVADDVGDALDDIVGVGASVAEEEEPTVVEEPTPTAALDDVGMEETTPAALDDVVKYVMGNKDAELTAPTVATPTAPKKTPAKTSTATSAVQRRAYARQYMVERGAKVEDLRSPAKIEEVMETEEFKTWVASR